MRDIWLIAAAAADFLAAALHLACIAGGPAWYRFFGAGEGMARMAERGALRPTLVTLGIASILAIWGLYALSGAGVLPALPLPRTVLILISAVYLARAAALPLMLRTMADRGTTFLIVSSMIVLALGLVHAIGLWLNWSSLGG